MPSFLVVSKNDQLGNLLRDLRRGKTGWSIVGGAAPGDDVYFYFGHPASSIFATARVATRPEWVDGPFPWTSRSRVAFAEFNELSLLDPPVTLEDLCIAQSSKRWLRTNPFQNTRKIPEHVASLLASRLTRLRPGKAETKRGRQKHVRSSLPDVKYIEGLRREILVEVRRRDPRLKARLLVERGSACELCGFDFSAIYGDLGEGLSCDIHHLQPLSNRARASETSMSGVRLLCPNCHRIAHRDGVKPIAPQMIVRAIKQAKALT